MATTFDTWLAACAAAGKGGARVRFEAVRGQQYQAAIDLSGDWTGAELTAYVRQQPDAAGDPLANFDVTGPVVVEIDGEPWSTFTATLADGEGANSTGSLPADDDGDGIADFPLFINLTPSGGSAELLAGGIMRVLGD